MSLATVASDYGETPSGLRGTLWMTQVAEALREKRVRQINAQAEVEAAALLRQAAATIMQSPAELESRRMQMFTEVGAEQNIMTIVLMPERIRRNGAGNSATGRGRRGGGKLGKRVGSKTAAAQWQWSRAP